MNHAILCPSVVRETRLACMLVTIVFLLCPINFIVLNIIRQCRQRLLFDLSNLYHPRDLFLSHYYTDNLEVA